jgi:hypothetical protein
VRLATRGADQGARRTRRRPAALLTLAVAGLSVLATLLAGPSASATATHPTGRAASNGSGAASNLLGVTIDSLAPAAPQPGDQLVISGQVTNNGSSDVRTVSVRLRMSPTALTGRAEIGQIVSGNTDRTGNPVDGSAVDLTTDLSPGSSVAYTITVPVANLSLSQHTASVRIIGVEALGDAVPGDGYGPEGLGLTLTFLPWFPPDATVTPTRVLWLLPLTDRPARDAADVMLNETTGTSVEVQGRLTRLLGLAEAYPGVLTPVVDPALMETLTTMAVGGYQVRTPSGALVPGTHSAAAAAWVAQARSTLTGPQQNVLAMLYAGPDLVALHRAGLDLDLTRTVTGSADRLATDLGDKAITTTLPWPADGLIDAGTLDALRAAGARLVLLSSSDLPPVNRGYETLDGVAPLTDDARTVGVLADTGLSAALLMPTNNPGAALLARQRLLAEVAATTLEDPGNQRTIVAAPPPLWSPDPSTVAVWLTALSTSRFMAPASLAELMALPAASGSGPSRTLADYPERARKLELSSSYLAVVAERRTQLDTLRALTSDASNPLTDKIEDALTRTESASWRSDRAGAHRLLTAVGGQLDSLLSSVRVLSRGTITFPGETGVVPVTVANDLSESVRVGLRLTGTPAVRFESSPFPTFTVAPGTKVSVDVPARVLGSGSVAVAVQLMTPDGRPYAEPTPLQVRSAAYAQAASWIVGGLLGVTVLLLGVNFVRRRRHPVTAPAPDGDDAPVPG